MYRKQLLTILIATAISGAALISFSVNTQASEVTSDPSEQIEETSAPDPELSAQVSDSIAEQTNILEQKPDISEQNEEVTENLETAAQEDVSEYQESVSQEDTAVTESADQVSVTSETPASSADQTLQDGVAGSHLEGQNKILYDEARTQLGKVANAEDDDGDGRIKAIVSVPASRLLEETLSGKLVEDTDNNRYYVNSSDIGITQKITKENLSTVSDPAVRALFDFNPTAITNALLADCPYDLYWFDKEKNVNRTTQPYYYVTTSSNGTQKICFDNTRSTVSIRFTVSADYVADPSGSKDDQYTVDATKARKAVSASENAKQIVRTAEGERLTDLEILQNYEKKICDLTSYNYSVTSAQPYGDPWQMIYVFDNDTSTNVTCEGYAKAMQYLCDETDFQDSSITCITVTGYLGYQSSAEPHMWNILHWTDGNNYLVDVTNSDTGTAGDGGKFFMVPVNYVAQEELSPELAKLLPKDMPAFAAYYAVADAGTDDERVLYYLYDRQALSTFTPDELSVYTIKISVSEGEQTVFSWNGNGLVDRNGYVLEIQGHAPVHTDGTSATVELPAGEYTATISATDILGRKYISLPVSFSVKERTVITPAENSTEIRKTVSKSTEAADAIAAVGIPDKKLTVKTMPIGQSAVDIGEKSASASTGDHEQPLIYAVMGAVAAAALALLRKKRL